MCETMISCDILIYRFSGMKNRKAVMLCHAHLFRFSVFFAVVTVAAAGSNTYILEILNKQTRAHISPPHQIKNTQKHIWVAEPRRTREREGVCTIELIKMWKKWTNRNCILHSNGVLSMVALMAFPALCLFHSQNSMKGKL